MGGKGCELCGSFILHVPANTRPLCTIHKAAQQNASAKAMAPKPAHVPRPFRKEKIYPVKPDDKPLLKRKRPVAKTTTSHEFVQDTQATFMFSASKTYTEFTFKTPEAQSPPAPAVPSPRDIRKRTQEERGRLFQALASGTKTPEDIEDLNLSLGSASMAESPIEPTPEWQASSR